MQCVRMLPDNTRCPKDVLPGRSFCAEHDPARRETSSSHVDYIKHSDSDRGVQYSRVEPWPKKK